jgi:hypothetical protein
MPSTFPVSHNFFENVCRGGNYHRPHVFVALSFGKDLGYHFEAVLVFQNSKKRRTERATCNNCEHLAMQPSTNSQFGAGDMVPLDYKMNGDGDKPVSLDQEGPVLLSQMATESSSLLSPVDPKTLPLGQKFKWLFSASTLGRRQNIDEVLASESSY